jgi:hypothetical protein
MQAFKLGENISLVFTTVLSEMKLGLVDEDEEVQEVTDRAYWERRGSKTTLEMTDTLLTLGKELDPELALKYNKFYIGLAKHGQPSNFVVFRPKKDWLRFEPRVERSEEIQNQLDEAGVDVMEYDNRWGRYRIRLAKGDIDKHKSLLKNLFERAYRESEQ